MQRGRCVLVRGRQSSGEFRYHKAHGCRLGIRILHGFGGFLIKVCPCRLLIGGLFNKKEEQKDGDTHPLDDTLKRLLSKLQVYHTISRPTPTVRLLSSLPTQHCELHMRNRTVCQSLASRSHQPLC